MERPDGIILTISQKYLKERGIKNWLADFMKAMNNDNFTYWLRLGSKPKQDVLYIYLIIYNKIRFRFNFVMYEKGGEFTTHDGRIINAKVWLVGCGPLIRPQKEYRMKGFQGFRYTQELF